MSGLARRLDRLERAPTINAGLFVVPVYAGMSHAEGLAAVFGEARPPAGAQIVFVRNALPPPDVPYDWWTLDHDSEAFAAAYVACRAKAWEANAVLHTS